MKKTIALGLSLLLLAGSAVSCGKEKENDLLTLKFNYDLSEYIDLPQYKGLPATGYRIEVTDEAVAQQICADGFRAVQIVRICQLFVIVFQSYLVRKTLRASL